MAIKKTKSEAKDHEIKVTRAKQFSNNDNIGFDVIINDVKILGCILIQGENEKGEYSFVSFPSHKAEKDGETVYYPYATVKLSANDQKEIEKQIEAMLE